MPSQFESTLLLLGKGQHQSSPTGSSSPLPKLVEDLSAKSKPGCQIRTCVIACVALFAGFLLVQVILDREFIGEAVINAALWNRVSYGSAIKSRFFEPQREKHHRNHHSGEEYSGGEPGALTMSGINTSEIGQQQKKEHQNQTITDMNKYLTECRLPRIDPWDPVLVPYLNPDYYKNWSKECIPTTLKITSLMNGYVQMDTDAKRNGTHCEFRCIYPKTDYDVIFGDWKTIDWEPDCDVVETQCKHEKLNNGSFYYNNMHIQIYKRLAYKEQRKVRPLPSTSNVPSNGGLQVPVEEPPDFGPDQGLKNRRAPDVHVIIFDSSSHTQMLRSFPKTLTFMRERMEAVSFPHLNKIGLNSRPNGYGMFFGFQAYKVEANPFGPEYMPPRDLWTLGGVYLDREPFVGFEYREKKYRTMMAEDWAKGVFNWPGNWGFDHQPTDHYLRPFHLRLEKYADANDTMTGTVYGNSCKEAHNWILDYLKDFMFVYEDEPKFSVSWMSCIAHNTVNGLYRVDDELFDLFRENEKRLENSFVFLMGDHGLRFGGIRWTSPGEVEDNNPALFVSIPKHLRYNDNLLRIMKENSRQLIAHFDIHATLLDIARHGSKMTAFTKFDQEEDPSLKVDSPFGSSLLRPFDKSTPRTCGTLKIPFEFCLCQFIKKNVTETEVPLAKSLAQKMVTLINETLSERNVTDHCAPLQLKDASPVEVFEFEPDIKLNVFQVTFETVPGDGKFWGFMKVENRGETNQTLSFISTRFPRLNEYGAQAFCIEDYVARPYCYCKSLLTSAPSTTPIPSTITTAAILPTLLANGTISITI